MHFNAHLVALTIILIVLILLPAMALADEAVLIVYFSPTCDHCTAVREEVLPPLSQAYGDRLIITYRDISQPDILRQLEETEQRLGKLNNPIPVIVLGDQIIASEDVEEIRAALTAALRQRLGEPASSTIASATPIATGSPSTAPTEKPSQGPLIHVAYIEKEGCSECARAWIVLQALQGEYPTMVISTFSNMRDADLVEAMGNYLELPQTRRLIAPSIYVGRDALIGDDEITTDNVRALLNKYVASGAPAFWEELNAEAGKSSIMARFRTMGPLAVMLAGLIDGINPCAFATIIFFVSTLAISQRRRGALLAVGLAFTAGVFITYLLVGLGAMRLLQWISALRIAGMVLYGLLAAGCFVLAGFSAYDYVLARRGKLHDMSLNLPDSLRERIKGRIRASRSAFVGGAFVSGLFVSVVELACTGQVYLPTISFVVGIPAMRTYAIAYLLVYNLFFIVPLLVVLFLVAYGVSAVRFQDWLVRNMARTKLVMVGLFLLLGGLLVTQLVHM